MRAGAVALLAIAAIFALGPRVDWNSLRRQPRRLVYLRVEQRSARPYAPSSARRKLLAAGGLGGVAVVGAVIIAISLTLIAATLVGTITDLLR